MGSQSLCILLCAGSSSRMGKLGSVKSKVLINLDDSWTVLHEVLTRLVRSGIDKILLVCAENLKEDFEAVLDQIDFVKPKIVIGGDSRSQSVKNALDAIPHCFPLIKQEIIMIHDGARPFFSVDLLIEAIELVSTRKQSYIFGVPVVNTIKVCSEDLSIERTLDRASLWEVQTPQIFPSGDIISAYNSTKNYKDVYDDSSLLERINIKVSIIKSTYANFKITTHEDVERAKHQLNSDKKGVTMPVHI